MDIKPKQTENLYQSQTSLPQQQADQKPAPRFIIADGAVAPIQNLVQVMSSVNTQGKEAQLNATSLPDNNGGRIQLNDPTVPKPDFTKIIPSK